jgi:hypothetical protein
MHPTGGAGMYIILFISGLSQPVIVRRAGFGLWVAIAILSLAASLAGRTFQHTSDSHTAVRSGSPAAKLQHLDRDSHDWSAPAARFVPPLWRVVAAHVPPPHEPAVAAEVQISLYNRPPPSC